MTPAPDFAPGIVTAADVVRELGAARGQLAGLDTRLAVIDVRTQSTSSTAADHEARIRRLEAFSGRVIGVALTASVASGALSGLIGWALGHIH